MLLVDNPCVVETVGRMPQATRRFRSALVIVDEAQEVTVLAPEVEALIAHAIAWCCASSNGERGHTVYCLL